MHREWYQIPDETAAAVNRCKQAGRRVVAVGTTVVRALEQAAATDGTVKPGAGEAEIFICPGHRFRVVDALLTNFHLPKSTLLVLVAAFAGREFLLGAYAEAVRQSFRFYSYGDAMFIHSSP
jgi:S-adenosylmethionine:tRNA ribosyltransferase-isomerase